MIRGSCLCGGVKYELRGEFRRANVCHCSRCQKHSGGQGEVQGRIAREAFSLVSGEELLRTFKEDGHMAKVFCVNCGSSLFGGTWPDGPEVSIRFGTLDDDPGITPQYHSFVSEVPAWDALPDDGRERYERRPPRGVA